MAVLEISNGESSYVSTEAINNAIQSLEDPLQRVSPGSATVSWLTTFTDTSISTSPVAIYVNFFKQK